MNPDQSFATPVAACSFPDAILGGISLNGLAAIKSHPELPTAQLVEATCSKCGTPIGKVLRIFAGSVACDRCCQEWQEKQTTDRIKAIWHALCPQAYRDTRTDHPSFPAESWKNVCGWDGGKSLMLTGETRAGKTRTAFLLLRRALSRGMSCGVLWPEDIKELGAARDGGAARLRAIAMVDVLLLDDGLMAASGEDRSVETLKQLIDLLIRHNRAFIITSQVGGSDMQAEAAKFGGPSGTALKRIAALAARIREVADIVHIQAARPPAAKKESASPF
jgi:hypothetical protein